jgi:hypothetical protein
MISSRRYRGCRPTWTNGSTPALRNRQSVTSVRCHRFCNCWSVMSCATGAWVLYEWFFIGFVGFAEGVSPPLEPHPSHTGAHWQGAIGENFPQYLPCGLRANLQPPPTLRSMCLQHVEPSMNKGVRAVTHPDLRHNYLITSLPSSPGKEGVEDSVKTMLSPTRVVVRRIHSGRSK